MSSFNTANVANMYYMFKGCSGLKELDLGNFDTSKVTWMPAMFYKCSSLEKVNLSSFDTSLVNNMSLMFAGCENLTDLDISNFNTANVESMGSMFSGCEKLKELNISGFKTPKLTDMSAMFGDCKNLTELKLGGFDTSKVKSMQVIFYGCSKLTSLDISNFTIGADVNIQHFFTTCKSLKTIKAPKQIADGIQIILPDNYLDSKQKKTSYLNKDFCNTTLTKEANPFGDIKESDWQYYYAKSALNYGVMNGKGTNDQGMITFDPNASMTRAEFVQALYNKEGKPAVTFTNKFSDVTGKEWFANAITWAADKNIVAGKGDKFDVNGKITRQEMATILYKYASFKGYMTTCDNNFEGYTDASTISNWAIEYMKWALDYGIMKGKGTRIAPLENATRAECATMLINFMETYEIAK